MTVINATLSSVVNRNLAAHAQTASAQTAASQNSDDVFGNAVNLDLSPPAQTAVANQGAGAPPAGGGGGVPIAATSSDSTDETLLVEEAKQKVIPEVGVSGADEVVDSKGDIDQVKLNQLLQQQIEKKSVTQV